MPVVRVIVHHKVKFHCQEISDKLSRLCMCASNTHSHTPNEGISFFDHAYLSARVVEMMF